MQPVPGHALEPFVRPDIFGVIWKYEAICEVCVGGSVGGVLSLLHILELVPSTAKPVLLILNKTGE